MVNQSPRYSVDSGCFGTLQLKLHGQLAAFGFSGDFSRLRGFSGFLLHELLLAVWNNAIALLMRITTSSGWCEKDAAVESQAPGPACPFENRQS